MTVTMILAGIAAAAMVWAAQPQHKPNVIPAAAHKDSQPVEAAVTPPFRRPLSYYQSGISNILFDAPVSSVSRQSAPKDTKPKASRPSGPESAPVAEPDPLTDYVYSGWVKHDGVTTALIENSKTREGTYLSVGDRFDEFGVVTEIGDETLTLLSSGKKHIVRRPGEYPLVPLNANAAYLRKEAAPAPGGQPNAAPNSGMPGRPDIQSFTPPNRQWMPGGEGFAPDRFPGGPASFSPSGGFQEQPILLMRAQP